MRFEQTIQDVYDRCPSLFQERWQVLDQLFCVIGNGYKWIDGELVDCDDSIVCEHNVILKDGEKARQDPEKVKQAAYKMLRKVGFKDDSKISARLDEMMQIKPIEFYPLCSRYSKLLNYPADIKSDWLEGVKETLQLVLEHGCYIAKDENDYMRAEREKTGRMLLELSQALLVDGASKHAEKSL